MSQRKLITCQWSCLSEYTETTKLVLIRELVDYCFREKANIVSNISLEIEPSLFTDGYTRVTVRAWTKK